jgi:AcrR family transcriptional regulator
VDRSSLPLPKTKKGRERREHILDAAMEAFAVQGSRSVSLASIAPAVGISEQGVMHYFPTKVHLLLGVLERRDERDTRRFGALAEQGVPFLELLVEIARANAAEPGLESLYGVLMAEGVSPDHPAHEWFASRNERVRRQLSAGLAAAQRSGAMRAGLDPDAVAAQLLALYVDLPLQRALGPGAIDVVSVFEGFVRSLSPTGELRAPGHRRAARGAA